ncbi:hypothetical protein EB118_24035 [bacterium]|nr:hypothetical protein [bacterium]
MNKPVIFRFKSQKERYNTYLYFANDKKFPFFVYTLAYDIIIDIPEELVYDFIKDIRITLKNKNIKIYYDGREISRNMYKM